MTFGIFGDDAGDMVSLPGSTDPSDQFTPLDPSQTQPAVMVPSVAPALQQVSAAADQAIQQIQQQQAMAPTIQSSTTVSKPKSALASTMPWILGGLAIAGLAALFVFTSKKKGDGDDEDFGEHESKSRSYNENPKKKKKSKKRITAQRLRTLHTKLKK